MLYGAGAVFESGNLTLGRWRGVPILLHWSVALGALVFSRGRFAPGFWLGYVVLVVVHELGHAVLVQRRGLRVRSVQVNGLGGVCAHEPGSPYDHAIIAWGGVLAQALVLLVPALLVTSLLPVRNVFLAQLLGAFIDTNLFLIAINLIPIAPLDGHLAWKLPSLWRRRRNGSAKGQRKKKSRAARRRTEPDNDTEDAAEMARRIARQAIEDARRPPDD